VALRRGAGGAVDQCQSCGLPVREIREQTAAVGQRDRIVKAAFASRAICATLSLCDLVAGAGEGRRPIASHRA
jgi:hypothetical protein